MELVEVTDPAQRGIWNELMRSEHPSGAVQHVGAQLCYLLVSDHGVLGALGFAAAALTLAARDTFIGWDADQRSRQLHRVIGLSRFLIRSSVHCRNLASKALGLALRRLPDDFQHRYGYRPLLVETFVEKGRYQGTSLAAANWLRVGETAGRGRLAASGAEVAVKAVWLYPLGRAWRAQLGVAENLAADVWAEHEFGGARLGDVRLGKRLVQIVQRQGEAPTKSFPGAAQNDQAAVRGYYRLIDHPADSEVTPENILAPHRQRTLQRMQGQSAVLCIQDGTDLNFAERAVTINAVIAWRLTLMTLLGRDTPELPADTLFTEIELAALEDFAQDRRQLPPDNLGRAVLTLAMLGGYLNYKRKQYAVPGHKVMWEGYTRLATITQVVERTRRLNEGSKLYQKMRRE